MGEYQPLRKLFHISPEAAQTEYERRVASKDTMRITMSIGDSQAFFCMDSKVYELILRTERLDKQIRSLMGALPLIAIEQYVRSSLIDEIVLTNEIEGVNSSRREIGDILDNLAKRDKRGRFQGIVEKYAALMSQDEISLDTCEDLRAIYDDLVLDEVVKQNPDHRPDGALFRAGPVSVLDAGYRPIHQGIEPESKIIECLDVALALLNDPSVELLVRVSAFHFLFAYIHPFYDGNGRMNRFISSYLMAREFSPIVGLRLSHAVKQRIERYYKAFSLCEHPLNRGDMTPFVIAFSEIIVDAMESMLSSLEERAACLDEVKESLAQMPGIESVKSCYTVGFILAQAALFAEIGITMNELSAASEMSGPTVSKRLDFFKRRGLLIAEREGRRLYYRLDIAALKALQNDAGTDAHTADI